MGLTHHRKIKFGQFITKLITYVPFKKLIETGLTTFIFIVSSHEFCIDKNSDLIGEVYTAISGLKAVKKSTQDETLLRLARGKEFIEKNFLQCPQIPEIARFSNLSEFHFYRSFKQAFGITPYKYILLHRLLHSKQLLNQQVPVCKVAAICGFPDASTYTKAFKRTFGKSPSQTFEGLKHN